MLIQFKRFLKKFKIFRLINYKLKKYHTKKFKDFNNLNNNSVVLDFGANIGDVASYINDMYKSKIYCYEPNPVLFYYLKNRFEGFSNIKIFNYAISKTEGYFKLYLHQQSFGIDDIDYSQAASLDKHKDNIDSNKYVYVKTVSCDNVLQNFPTIDIIKIDIEGSEYDILPEIIKNKNNINKVICELHGNPTRRESNGKIKNYYLTEKYFEVINLLKKEKLYGSWFIEQNE